jgi:hypothetical protein
MAKKTRVVLEAEAGGEGPEGAAATPHAAWATRRDTKWRIHTETLGSRTPTDPGVHAVTVALINAGERSDGTRIGIMRIAVDVETDESDDPVAKALGVIDVEGREPLEPFETRAAIPTGSSVISLMPERWPLGRRLTDYVGGITVPDDAAHGISAWQLNNGSWMALPLADAESGMILTIERRQQTMMLDRLDLTVERRRMREDGRPSATEVLGDLSTVRPQIVRFETAGGGFIMEAGDERHSWRFEMAPAPTAQNTVPVQWLLTHDIHLMD